MFEKESKMLKHLDFIIIDIICMYAAYFIAYIIREGFPIDFDSMLVRASVIIYLIVNLLVTYFASSYKNVVKRGYLVELRFAVMHVLGITLFVIMAFFVFKLADKQSRAIVLMTAVFYLIFTWTLRCLRKSQLRKTKLRKKKSLLLITSAEKVDRIMKDFNDERQIRYAIRAIVLTDSEAEIKEYRGIPVESDIKKVHDFAKERWLDGVLISPGADDALSERFLDGFLEMGIPVHHGIFHKEAAHEWKNSTGKVGNYIVYTESMRLIGPGQMALKRLMDIVGGLLGCAAVGILYIFIAPRIKKASPGPVFFKQERVGRNGRTFYMYKFRTMVPNADELKAQYMKENRIADGMMFKMDFDPRVIGNELLPDGTKKTGIGDFLRRTSLDEFPQFFNVLKGDMSLVGTRPPTLDEWKKYLGHHRVRMAIKPGITGLWQVSGRSEITDFEEVVRLDREYINTFSLGMDMKILAKTITTVLDKKGSM